MIVFQSACAAAQPLAQAASHQHEGGGGHLGQAQLLGRAEVGAAVGEGLTLRSATGDGQQAGAAGAAAARLAAASASRTSGTDGT